MNPNPDRFKQKSPHDQLAVLLGALEGHLSNYEDGIINGAKFMLRVADLIDDTKKLVPFMNNKWERIGEKFKPVETLVD